MQKYSRAKVLLIIASFCFLHTIIIAQPSLKNEMRLPWATATGDYLRDWLIIGGFPNQDGKGIDTDFLRENGGEISIEPTEEMTHTTPTGSKLVWKKYSSPYNYVNFFAALNGLDFNMKAAYAFAKISRPVDGKVVISFGHNVNNKVWINGKLVYESRNDYTASENRQIEVDMNKGDNSILLKSVHGGWTWGFVFRIIEPDKFSLAHNFKLSPSIISDNNDELIIKTDRSLNPEIQKINVNVKVVTAGGKIVIEKTARRGEQVSFNTSKWNDGAYDICFRSHDTKGEIITNYLYWYKGDAISAAKKIIASVPNNPTSSDELIHVMLSEMIYDKLGKDLDKVDSSLISRIYSPLLEYEELKLNTKVKNASVRPNGFVRLAYLDEIDNTPQFCRAYLPLEYDPNKKWPLVINLHGYNGANPVYVKWWSIDQRHTDLVDRYPVINIEPHGRGNTSYNGIGELDVLKCIEMAKELFNVDEDRIYLKGESMGGGGTWNVGTRNPELFAAIAPVYGGWDYHVSMNENQIAKLTERERFINERNSNFAQADALLTTPVFVSHGDIDLAVDVRHSRYAANMLQRWGYDIRYHELPGFGHEGMPYIDQLMPWFLKHERIAHPKVVRVRSGYLKSASAHWVKVLQRENPYSFIEVEAEILINNTIRLSTKNVLDIELSPSSTLIDPEKPVKVIWNINDIRDTKINNGKISLRAENYNPLKIFKTPKIEGPVSDLSTTPFAVIIGTISEDSLMVKMCRQKAMDFVRGWKEWQKYEPRVFNDYELNDEDMKKYSLILYGDSKANLVTKKMGNKIPLKISENIIKITGKSFLAENASVQMIYPHPLNSERYVSVIGATSGKGMYFYNGASNQFDFVIQDGIVGREKDKLYIAKGLFDYNWQINSNLLELGDPEIRKVSPVIKVLPDLKTTIDNLPTIDQRVYESYSGKYEIQPGINIKVFIDNNKLMATTPDGNTIQLLPINEVEYFIDGVDILITFFRNEKGVVENLIVHQGVNDMSIRKTE
ncbi:MAG: prolyl oligopeptidase family serine peptidase [Melioribacteraceae bacterium]|nr:prolyl oligopeptidase family serine peptidase [Melioribacteraceae bacterium]